MRYRFLFAMIVLCCAAVLPRLFAAESPNFVRVSRENPAYFELTDGTPYIPIGVNLCILRELNSRGELEFIDDETRGLEKMEFYFRQLAENGGNYCRIWLGSKFFEIEYETAGQYDAAYVERIARVLELAKKYQIRIKFCIEHFRTTKGSKTGPSIFYRKAYDLNPPLTMSDYVKTKTGEDYYLNRCRVFADRFKDDPYVFAWELWNEVNCIPDSANWTEKMLPKLHIMFPRQMVIQSLGSFDNAKYADLYRRVITMKDNDVAQVHRYLDPGAALDVCHGPMDILASDMTTALIKMNPGKPVMATELGAVEWRHSGPSKLYELDKEGILLHDILFAPFFSGAAGSGHCWHWYQYIEKNNLWWHVGRFSKAVAGVNPIRECFQPFQTECDFYRVYGLKGTNVSLLWLRSQKDNWKTELVEKKTPETFKDFEVDVASLPHKTNTAILYDPWTDRETPLKIQNGKVRVPQMKRSAVLRVF